MNFKKVTAFAAAGVITAVALTGCGSSANQTAGNTSSSEAYKIGICQLIQHPALDEATKGFKDALTEKLGDKVTFDEQNASGDSNTCTTIANQFVSSNYSLIFANATQALQAASAATADIPIVGTSITDYATALDISDWTGVTGENITGTSDLAPLEEQAVMFKELLPDAKKVGLLYCSAEANSKYQVNIVTAELEKLGYECTEYAFADSNDVAAVTTNACTNSDALYIPTDNTAAANTELIASITEPAKVPVIAGEEGICEGCGIATLSISYYDIGKKAGEMAYEILVDGKTPAEMKIQYAQDLTKKYVPARTEDLGITVPDDYVALGD